jgi:signal transduction histidine kinase
MRTSPEATDAMTAAQDGHAVAISRAYRLLRDASLPTVQQQLSFVLAAPVYATSPNAPDSGRFRGWLLMGLRGGDFLHEVIGTVARDTVDVALYDPSFGLTTPVATWRPAAATDTGLPAREVTVSVPQRSWELTVQPTVHLVPGSARNLDRIAWLVGLVITALLAALIRTVSTSRDRALRRVDEATVALRDDIHRREEVEHQLRQRESELVGFAGVIAHDLRSPLARITGYADFLREEAAPRLEPVHRDFLDRLYGGAERMRSLIDDLLDYATADNRDLATTSVDLRELVDDVLAERVGDSVEPTVVIDRLPAVEGDPTLLRQVLDNLIGNALKYTKYGDDPYVRIAGVDRGTGEWRIDVVDHGIGIPEEQRETVFGAFNRADGSAGYPGTGLGLAIVQRIVERHGGTVGVAENPGGGSRFWFTVPKTVAQLSPSAVATSASS